MSSREELLAFGYIREYAKSVDKDIPPNDLIHLIVLWICLMDYWDKDRSHDDIRFDGESDQRALSTQSGHRTVIGENVIRKGNKESWTFRASSGMVIAGVIEDDVFETNSNLQITDFTTSEYNGYGISLYMWYMYHSCDDFSGNDGKLKHAQQFKIEQSGERVLTMELDLTQSKHKHGLLSFKFHHELRRGLKISEFKSDAEYTNIVYDTIDVNKKYRAAFSLSNQGTSIELLSEVPLFHYNYYQ